MKRGCGSIVKLRSILGLEGESESLLEKEQSGSEVEQVRETRESRGSSPLSHAGKRKKYHRVVKMIN